MTHTNYSTSLTKVENYFLQVFDYSWEPSRTFYRIWRFNCLSHLGFLGECRDELDLHRKLSLNIGWHTPPAKLCFPGTDKDVCIRCGGVKANHFLVSIVLCILVFVWNVLIFCAWVNMCVRIENLCRIHRLLTIYGRIKSNWQRLKSCSMSQFSRTNFGLPALP